MNWTLQCDPSAADGMHMLALSLHDILCLGLLCYLAITLTAELPGRQSSALKLLLHMLLDRGRGGMLLLFTAVTSRHVMSCHVMSCYASSCHAMPAHVMSCCDVSHYLKVLLRFEPPYASEAHG